LPADRAAFDRLGVTLLAPPEIPGFPESRESMKKLERIEIFQEWGLKLVLLGRNIPVGVLLSPYMLHH
jgi:hypothetical protein